MLRLAKTHKKLVQKYPWYDAWHQQRGYFIFHWLVFAIFTFTSVAMFATQSVSLDMLRAEFAGSPHVPIKPDTSLHGGTAGFAGDRILVAFQNNVSADERANIMKRHRLTESATLDSMQ